MKVTKEYLEEEKFLPGILRDFHNCKEIFKEVDRVIQNRKENPIDSFDEIYLKDFPNWRIAHIYTIDFFLWKMAKKGYKLQKIRNYEDSSEQSKMVNIIKIYTNHPISKRVNKV